MAGPMGFFDYTDDTGAVFRIRMDASNAAAVGAVAATATVGLPRRTKPRYILARHPTTGRERRIVATTPGETHFVGGAGTISLPDFGAGMAATAFEVMGRVGEKRYV